MVIGGFLLKNAIVSLIAESYSTAIWWYIVKISQKRYSAADINFLQPLSAQAQQARKMNISSTWCIDIIFPWLYCQQNKNLQIRCWLGGLFLSFIKYQKLGLHKTEITYSFRYLGKNTWGFYHHKRHRHEPHLAKTYCCGYKAVGMLLFHGCMDRSIRRQLP